MKKIVYKFSWILLFPLLFACTQPEYLKPNKSLIPKAADIQVTVNTSYDENFLTTVTFEYTAPAGTIPVFIFNGKEYITQSRVVKTYKKAGTYAVEVKAMNSHGISDGSKLVEFVVEYDYIAPYDPAEDIRFISGGSEKTWVMDAATKGHMGCGPSGSNGLDWWSANPYDKEGMSLYDNQLTFRSNGTFTFDPMDGMTYVNVGSGYET
ncbi:MAG TPA: PKD domain-containing protein, partial [Bacteroidales bacterium]|nr:PKD domain-containing protein [Bacteroidales bacterium]